MNIWIFNQYAIPPDLPGGTRHYDLGRELVQRGHQVTIIATSFHHYMHKETRLKSGERWKAEDIGGVKFVWLRTPPYYRNDWRRVWNMMAFALRAWWIGRKLPEIVPDINKPEVVIGSSPHLLTPLVAYWTARHYRVAFVMEVRDLWPQAPIEMGIVKPTNPFAQALKVLERFLYCHANKIIILGPQMRDHIISSIGNDRSIVYIPNGVDISRFKLEGLCKTDDEFSVLYLGAHSPSNALEVLIFAAEYVLKAGFDNIYFVLVGDGPSKKALMELVKLNKIVNVRFLDSVPKVKVPEMLQRATILVLTKHPTFGDYSGSILKIYDYMAASKPIIFSGEVTDNPVLKSKCGLVTPPGDAKALADAIIQLYHIPKEEREAMGRRGRAYVEEHHDIRKLARRLEQVLLEVVAK